MRGCLREHKGCLCVLEIHCSEEPPKIPPSENSWGYGNELGTTAMHLELRGVAFSASETAGPLGGEQQVKAEQGHLGKVRSWGTGRDKGPGCPSQADSVGTQRALRWEN